MGDNVGAAGDLGGVQFPSYDEDEGKNSVESRVQIYDVFIMARCFGAHVSSPMAATSFLVVIVPLIPFFLPKFSTMTIRQHCFPFSSASTQY